MVGSPCTNTFVPDPQLSLECAPVRSDTALDKRSQQWDMSPQSVNHLAIQSTDADRYVPSMAQKTVRGLNAEACVIESVRVADGMTYALDPLAPWWTATEALSLPSTVVSLRLLFGPMAAKGCR